MSSDDRFSFVLAAVLAATVVLGVSQMRKPVVGGLADPPRVGRAASEVLVGPVFGGTEEATEWEPDEEASRAEERVRALFRSREWPAFARMVVFHPLAEPEVPAGLEEGPAYHVVIGPDASVSWTPRGLAGAPSQPPGIPAHAAIRALHVALPAFAKTDAARLASARALWREAARTLGERATLFADEVPESTVQLPAGFDRAAWIAPQESRGATRARGQSTQPASRPGRVPVGFGRMTIQAAVASTFASRMGGLGGRKSLEQDEGLLFVYRSPDARSFWMKDCLISLDIIYLKDDGEVLSVGTAPPPDPRTPEAELQRYASPAPCRLVLEVAGGLAARMGVKKGSKLALPGDVARLFEKADP